MCSSAAAEAAGNLSRWLRVLIHPALLVVHEINIRGEYLMMARFAVMLTVILPLFLAACGGGTHTTIAETFPAGTPPPGTTPPPGMTPPPGTTPLPPDNEALRYPALLRVLQTNGGTRRGLGAGLTVDQGHVTATDDLGAFDEQRMDFNEGGPDAHVVWESYVSTRASTTVVSVTNVSRATPLLTNEYVDFGYWMKEHVAPDNLITTDVGLYSFGSDRTYPVTELKGHVRYLGPATGLYVDIRDQSHGRFFAAADLTAYFNIEEGDSGHDAKDRYSIFGRLSDFRNKDGRMGNEWAVDLNRIGGSSSGVYDAAAGTFSGGTTTGGGSWQGAFYPPSSSDKIPEYADQPDYISGTFNAHIQGVGHVAGAWLGKKYSSGPPPRN